MPLRSLLALFILNFCTTLHSQDLSQFPVWQEPTAAEKLADWLVKPITQKAAVYRSADGKDLILTNGLLKRVFRIAPSVTCVDFVNLSSGQQLLRAVAPEARLVLNGKTYHVGGLQGQTEKAYLLPEWLDGFKPWSDDFALESIQTEPLKPLFNWKPGTWASNTKHPTGTKLVFIYKAKVPELSGIRVHIRYELYDGIPLMMKGLAIQNLSAKKLIIDQAVSEILAFVEGESSVGGQPDHLRRQYGLYVETNYNFGTDVVRPELSARAVHWKTDSSYTSQVNYGLLTPCVLEIYPDKVTGIDLSPGEIFGSVRTYELLLDSYDRERRGLAVRKMYRTVAPWTTQNPIFMHLISENDQQVRDVIGQCAATGYEGIILSFGSHCNMEDTSAANIRRWKELADYAHAKGLLLGSYSLFSSRRISDADDVIDPKTGLPDKHATFGNAPCFGSDWGIGYAQKLKKFMGETGFDIFENDGPYPGDVCASTTHPGHKNLGDSQWRQFAMQADLYRWCNENGVYVNAPDWYFLQGAHKIALGYREVNFSLSRDQQKILNRQNIYDGTWEKTPSMGWGFVPLTKYHGGGPESVLEPLSEHLDDYRQLMVQYYGAGVQACYRGPRLYDTEATRKMVQQTIAWYKTYRDILNADIIHLRRPDGRDWDGILHVDPSLTTRGFVLLYNPLKTPITRTIQVPLYYTGLSEKAVFYNEKGEKIVKIDRDYNASITVDIPAGGWVWYAILR